MPKYCVIIEWGDGTVAVNGPYDTQEAADIAAWPIAMEVEGESNADEITKHADSPAHYGIREDSDEDECVYAQIMGTPVQDV